MCNFEVRKQHNVMELGRIQSSLSDSRRSYEINQRFEGGGWGSGTNTQRENSPRPCIDSFHRISNNFVCWTCFDRIEWSLRIFNILGIYFSNFIMTCRYVFHLGWIGQNHVIHKFIMHYCECLKWDNMKMMTRNVPLAWSLSLFHMFMR